MKPMYYKCEDCGCKIQIFSENEPVSVLHEGCAGEMRLKGRSDYHQFAADLFKLAGLED